MLVASANKLLDKLFNNTDFIQPTTLYLSLHTADPAGTGANEVTGGSYARQAITFSTASSGAITSEADIEFSGMPAVTVTHVGIWDASSAGTVWWEDALDTQKTVSAGDTFRVSAGDYDISLS